MRTVSHSRNGRVSTPPLPERGRFWRGHIESWAKSGVSQADYCRKRELSRPAFGYWRAELKKREQAQPLKTARHGRKKQGAKSKKMIPVKVIGSMGSGIIEMVLGTPRTLRLYRGFDQEDLRKIIHVVEDLPC